MRYRSRCAGPRRCSRRHRRPAVRRSSYPGRTPPPGRRRPPGAPATAPPARPPLPTPTAFASPRLGSSFRVHQHLHGLTAFHHRQPFFHLRQSHPVGHEGPRIDRPGFEQFHRASDKGRRVVEGPHQRELFVVSPAGVHPDGRARGATPKQYHGASPPHPVYGLLPHLGAPGRIHRHVGPPPTGQPPEVRAHVLDILGVHALAEPHGPHPVEPPPGLA